MNWKKLSSKIVLENNFFKIHEDKCEKPDGKIIEKYYRIDRPEVAVITAFTKKMELILIQQYRHPVNSVDFELPAGYIEDFEDDIIKAAKRELLEETGYSVQNPEKIHTAFASAGLMTNKINFFVAFDAIKTAEQNLDAAEDIVVHLKPWEEALQMTASGKIKDMASITGILLTREYLSKREQL